MGSAEPVPWNLAGSFSFSFLEVESDGGRPCAEGLCLGIRLSSVAIRFCQFTTPMP